MSRLSDTGKQIKEVFGRFSKRQKIGIGLATALTIAGLVWIVVVASATPYRVLFSDIPPENIAQVTEALDSKGIPHQMSGETTISVPEDRLHEARIHLAGSGLLEFGGAGFELFDEADFGMTAFTQKVNYQRAMESELARTIRAIDNIKSARVHLVMPEDALFKEDQKQPSASVVITTKSGGAPKGENIESVRYLISSAVPGLDPNQVTVLDNFGRLLARGSKDGATHGFDQAQGLSAGIALEQELQARVLELLEPMVGPGRSRARVRVEMDNSQQVETVELFDPDKAAIRSEQRSEQKSMSGAPNSEGAPGAISNLPGGEGATGGSAASSGTSTNEIVNYDISKTVRQTTQSPQRIRRISVAVVLDEDALSNVSGLDPEEVGEEAVQVALDEQVARITGLVGNVVGADQERGDQVLVSLETFAPTEEIAPAEETFWTSPEFINPLLRYGLPFFLLLIVLFFILRPILSNLMKPVEEGVLIGDEGEPLSPEGGPMLAAEGVQGALPSATERKEKLREEILALGKEDIDRVSKVISQWIRIGSAQTGR